MRRPGLLLALVVALLALTGCTKPTPEVTIQSGGTTVRSGPVNYLLDGKTVTDKSGVKALTVRPGATIGISVDRQTAEAGWVVLFGGRQRSPFLTDGQHYFSFQLSPEFATAAESTLAVFQQGPTSGAAAGSWLFTIREGS